MISPLSHTLKAPELPQGGRLDRAAESFERDLKTSANRKSLEEAAAKFVSSAFVVPLLESMQQSPLRPAQGAFAVGGAEKRFAPLLHQHFADRVTQSSKLSIVNAIVDRFASRLDKETFDVRA